MEQRHFLLIAVWLFVGSMFPLTAVQLGWPWQLFAVAGAGLSLFGIIRYWSTAFRL